MYIIEKAIKLFLEFKKNTKGKNQPSELENLSYCKHLYVPIDSDKEYLACAKCGHVKKNSSVE